MGAHLGCSCLRRRESLAMLLGRAFLRLGQAHAGLMRRNDLVNLVLARFDKGFEYIFKVLQVHGRGGIVREVFPQLLDVRSHECSSELVHGLFQFRHRQLQGLVQHFFSLPLKVDVHGLEHGLSRRSDRRHR